VLGVIALICSRTVDEVTVAEGAIVPPSSVQLVQHLEGGIVAAIRVSEGQHVDAGEVLVQLDNRQEMAALAEITARYVNLLLRRERLSAIVQQREPDFEEIGTGYPQLINDHRRTLAAQRDQQRSALSVLSAQVGQREQELQQQQRQLESAREQADIIAEQTHVLEQAVEAGVASRQTYLQTTRTLSTAKGEVARLTAQLTITRELLSEVMRRREGIAYGQVQEARNELATIGAEIEQVKGLVDKELDRVERLDIRSPIEGLVQDLKVRSIGEVLPAGGQLSRIVPITDELDGAIRISPTDIAHLRIGQPVHVRVSTFDTRRYGSVDAVLSQLSAITFPDERGAPYYKGTIKLNRSTIGSGVDTGRLLPGMTLTANIVTGSRSLVSYLLAPNAALVEAADAAAKE
jgi:HlyD family type I secretion membrane fusion protein